MVRARAVAAAAVPAAMLLANALNLITQFALPHYLLPQEYTNFALLWSYGQLAAILGFEWSRLAVLRFGGRDTDAGRQSRELLLTFYAGVAVLFLVGVGGGLVLEGRVGPVAIVLLYGLAQGLFDGRQALARAIFDNGYFSVSWVARSAATTIAAVFTSKLCGSGTAAVLSMAVAMLIVLVGGTFARRTNLKFPAYAQLQENGPEIRALFTYGVAAAAAGGAATIFATMFRTLVAKSLPDADAGGVIFTYDLGQKVISIIGLAVNITVLQRSIREFDRDAGGAGVEALREQISWSTALMVPAAAGFVLVGRDVAHLVVPELYRDVFKAALPLSVAFGALWYWRVYAIDPILLVVKQPFRAIWASVVALVLLLPLELGLRTAGFNPMHTPLLAVLASAVLASAVSVLTVVRSLSFPWPLRDLGAVSLATSAMAAIVVAIPTPPGWWHAVLSVASGALVYCSALALLNFGGLRVKVMRTTLRRLVNEPAE